MSQNSRLAMSRSWVIALLTMLAVNFQLGTLASAQSAQPQPGSRYHVVHEWPVLPDGRDLGAVSGIAVDSHGKPTPLPPIVPETEEEKRRHSEAEARRDQRLAARKPRK